MNHTKTSVVSILAIILALSCSSPNSQKTSKKIEAGELFEQYAQTISNKSDWLSFTVEHKLNGEETWSNNVSLCYKPDEQACYLYEEYAPVKISHDGFYMYNPDENSLFMLRHCEGKDTDSPYLSYKSTVESTRLSYLSSLFLSPMKDMKPDCQLSFTTVSDTVIRGTPCYRLTALTPESQWTYRRGDSIVKGVSQDLCHFYINKKTEMVDSLTAVEQLDTTRARKYSSAVLKNISLDDRSRFYDSVFDFNSDRFRNFTVYDEYMWSYGDHPTNSVTDELLNFPVVNLKNDTIYLKDEDGCVLLNLWTFSCSSCIENLYRYKKQTDSLNYRVLEKEGIKIMAINYLSNNMNKIGEIATKTSTCDIVYSAKGMRQFISIPYLGYYYLLSPSKEVIYESSNLGDYSKLLEAKREYERNNKY